MSCVSERLSWVAKSWLGFDFAGLIGIWKSLAQRMVQVSLVLEVFSMVSGWAVGTLFFLLFYFIHHLLTLRLINTNLKS